ncbi:hypothetical protein SAMN06265375_1112 [Muriicola jejuensis]|uniref:Uncharacterized protein n=1 Tax=Muriicola jejuensis TaxID=504488 RepID=A0A6P0UER6_9FLAO|nr:hypothetical protein [Muriicola jejuensis]NER11754.1 hypothetical protein [Muriicola jejuensis]SMP26870.1 hypothetical protein SAMN06265375_1112 [Muriicola jejuensis]
MQRTEIIDKNQLFELIEYILSDSKTEFYESYSEMEKEIVRINNLFEFQDYFDNGIANGKVHFGFGIYNPESKGKFFTSKIKLNPKYCDGKTYRYRIDGWAIIFIQLDLKNGENQIECNVSVNSKKRAENWKSTNPEFGNPELWEWKNVESRTRKIINRLKKTTHNNGYKT